MAEYELLLSGVHYGANGDSVAGQKETEEMHVRTRELLMWIDRERPLVVLSPDPVNPIHRDAVMARAQGRRIGRVAFDDVEKAWRLLSQSGQPMVWANVKEVFMEEHGYVVVTVIADELLESRHPSASETDWKLWLSDLPLLPPSERLQKEMEAEYVLDNQGEIKVSNYYWSRGDATAISSMETVENASQWFDVSGHRLAGKPTKQGVYICDGKKFIVK